MDPQEGQSVIASYLAGRRVERPVLGEAVGVVNADPEYVSKLREVLGNRGDWVTECDVFRLSLAEFTEMSPEQRLRDMPESAAHLSSCDPCREAYWQVAPLWVVHSPTGQGTQRRLVDPIAVTLEPQGLIRPGLSGPPPLRRDQFAAAADAPEAEATAHEGGQWGEWTLEDVEADKYLHVAMQRDPSGGVQLRCRIEEADGSDVDLQQVRVEIRDRRTGATVVSGPLLNFERRPLLVEAGSWQLRLLLGTGSSAQIWEIPFDLEPSRDA